jgi:hypothetical protein
MQSSKLLFNSRLLILSRNKYLVQWNSIQSPCFFHTCLPMMNKDMVEIDRAQEQPHMRIEAKAIIEQKRRYNEE